jgi:hypothetical protein
MLSFYLKYVITGAPRCPSDIWRLTHRVAFHNATLSHVATLFRNVVEAIPRAALIARWSFISLGRKTVMSFAHLISVQGKKNALVIRSLLNFDQIDCFLRSLIWHSSHAKFDVAQAPTQSSEIMAGFGGGGGLSTLKKLYLGLVMISIWILCFRYAGSYAYEQGSEARFVKCCT